MEQSEFLKALSETLERLAIPYLITGSMASATYGEPRFTNDVDVEAEWKLVTDRLGSAS